MLYAITEIVVFLLIALAIGIGIGWFSRGRGVRSALVAEWGPRFEDERDRNEALRKGLADETAQANTARAALAKAEKDSAKLRADHTAATAALQAAEQRADDCEARAGDLDKQLKAARSAAANPAPKPKRAAPRPKAAAKPAAAPASKPPASAAEARKRVAEIATRTAGDAPTSNDDLKLINGIGPKIEAMLKEMGITSYRQIAAFTADDLDTVAAALKAFPDRMQRDDWKGQAGRLQKEKHKD
ncbi:MAG: hypothetical protein KDG50_13460 [Chromatiales bacterium]|nr:hypothetical protein [Chromatiales bacterium]